MSDYLAYAKELSVNGFAIIDNIYSTNELATISQIIAAANTEKDTFRKSEDLFAIRQFLKEIPEAVKIIVNKKLQSILSQLFGQDYFVVKSIYFDKPPASNWFVALHQDLTISVDKKMSLEGYSSWTIKQNQFAVQPPTEIMENIVTIRIHLDDTDENNGALKVIPASHLRGVIRTETIDWQTEKQVSCNVLAGGVMLMKPLLLHSSGRTTNSMQRRVIHIEFANTELPAPFNWSERINLQEG